MSDQQQALATAAVMRGSCTVQQIEFAVTGEPIADLFAGIRVLADHSKLSARQVQHILECYAKLYKDAADQADDDVEYRRKLANRPLDPLAPVENLLKQYPVDATGPYTSAARPTTGGKSLW